MTPSFRALEFDPVDVALDRARFAGFCLALMGTAFSISLASIGGGVYAATLAVSILKNRACLPRPVATPFFAAMIAAVVASAAVNHFPVESASGIQKYLWGFMMLYAAVDVLRARERWAQVAVLLLLCEGTAAASGIWQDFFGRDFIAGREAVLFTEKITRITGPFKHCNDFGTFLIPGWLFGLSAAVDRWRRGQKGKAALAGVILVLVAWALVRTIARSAMIGAGVGMVVLALTMPYRKWIFGTMASCIAAAWLIPSPVSTRLHQLVAFGKGLNERVYLMKASLKMIDASPWVGLGPNTYSRWFPIYNPPDPKAPVIMYAHNSYLQMATEIGWIGLGVFLMLLGACLGLAIHRLREPDTADVRWIRAAALASAIGLLVNALFESLLQSTQLRTLFWCLLGIALAQPLVAARAKSRA